MAAIIRPRKIGTKKQLFFDNEIIDDISGLKRTWFQARKHPDNPLILYTSDHGEFLGDYGCVGKRSFLDPAARVPLLVRFPARFGADVRCDQPVCLVDALPTLLGAAGLDTEPQHAGVDLSAIRCGLIFKDL